MKFRLLTSILVLVLTGSGWAWHFLRGSAGSQSPPDQSGSDSEWQLMSGTDFPVWIALNSLVGKPTPEMRFVFLLVDESHFNEGDLRKLLTDCAELYAEPDDLTVTAFSNKAELQKAVKGYLSPGFYLESRTGYFRARYLRSNGEEKFYYSPDPKGENYITITIKAKSIRYSGNLDDDLLTATDQGDSEKIETLLRDGADVHAKNKNGDTPLLIAASQGLPAIVRSILQKGANVNEKLADGTTAIHFTASKGDVETANVLVSYRADVNVRDNSGESPLSIAAYNGYKELVVALLKAGAEVNTEDQEGNTPLMQAAINGSTEIVRLLLSQGSNVNASNAAGRTALMLANNDRDTVRLIISAGALIEAGDHKGWTPLMFAARNGHLLKINALLAAGANTNATSMTGDTALSLARLVPDNDEIIQILTKGSR